MANVKKKLKYFGGYVWEMTKASLPGIFMYLCAGAIMMMLILRGKEENNFISWTTMNKVWVAVCMVAAAAYNGLICYAHGGSHYEMLVSGNIKRATTDMYGNEYKISSHKEAKEYRVWKGFVMGAFTAILTLVIGLVFGFRQEKIDGTMTISTFVCFILSGWSIMPFYAMNQTGTSVSYFITCVFAVVPVVVSGVFYIIGAYARRRKTIRQQEIADKAAQAATQKEKKINYGGLPGTKPKKRK